MTDAEILAGSVREEVTIAAGALPEGPGVRYRWPDFGFGSRLGDYCSVEEAERGAIRVRREWLERADGG